VKYSFRGKSAAVYLIIEAVFSTRERDKIINQERPVCPSIGGPFNLVSGNGGSTITGRDIPLDTYFIIRLSKSSSIQGWTRYCAVFRLIRGYLRINEGGWKTVLIKKITNCERISMMIYRVRFENSMMDTL